MFPFMFNPYFGRNNTVRILDQVIPKINTISVSDSTESTVLGISVLKCGVDFLEKVCLY